MSIDNGSDSSLATRDLILQPPPLTGETLDGIDFARGEIYLFQFLRIDEGHLGQRERVYLVTF
jgi:hypothetical protein